MSCTESRQKKLIDRAKDHQIHSRFDEALKDYQAVLDLNPDSKTAPEALLQMAVISELNLKKPEVAELYYTEILKKDGKPKERLEALERLAQLFFDNQRSLDKAANYLQELLDNKEKKEDRDELWFRKAKTETFLGQFSQARESLQKLVDENPESPLVPAALLSKAESYHFEKNLTETMKTIEELTARFPESQQAIEAELIKGQCLENDQRWKEALRLYEKLRKKYPNPQVIQARIDSLRKRMRKSG